jgi:hypothetical protein
MNISLEDIKGQPKITIAFVVDDYGFEVPIIVARRSTVDDYGTEV